MTMIKKGRKIALSPSRDDLALMPRGHHEGSSLLPSCSAPSRSYKGRSFFSDVWVGIPKEFGGPTIAGGVKPMRLSAATTILLGVFFSACPATAKDAYSDALQCSEAALTRYALSSSDTPESIADMAFDNCAKKWELAAEIAVRSPNVSHLAAEAQEDCIKQLGVAACAQPLPPNVSYMQAAKRLFRRQAATEVLDIRAKAAGK
jgi:hypothetical protein